MKALSRRAIIAAAVFVAAAAFLAYLPSLKNAFLSWDDGMYVYANPGIHAISFGFLKWIFTSPLVANYHPLTMLSYAVDYQVWELNPFGYHLTNAVFHSLNTLLVFLLTVRISRLIPSHDGPPRPYNALIAGLVTALLFGLHPIHVESVAWISERKDVLCGFFFILTVLMYLEYASPGTRKTFYYAATLVFFMLALMSKPMAVTLPVVFLILDSYPLGRIAGIKDAKRLFLEKMPFFSLSAVSAMLTLWAQSKGGTMASLEFIPLWARLAVAVRSYAFYLYKIIVPLNLAPIYPYPVSVHILDIEYAGSLAVLLLITAFCVSRHRRQGRPCGERPPQGFFLAVWLYFLITLVPVIGLVQVGLQAAADRYTYLPSLSLFMLAGFCVAWLFERQGKAVRIIAAVSVFLILTALTVLTTRQELIWKDSFTLWDYQIEKYPHSEFSYFQRGVAHRAFSQNAKALEAFSTVIKLNKGFSMAYYERGVVYRNLGNLEKSAEDFSTVITLISDFSLAYNDRGIVYGEMGRYDEALKDFSKAIELNPSFDKAYGNRGFTLIKSGAYAKAVEDIKKAIFLNPSNFAYYSFLGEAYSKLGRAEEARVNFEKAASLSNGR